MPAGSDSSTVEPFDGIDLPLADRRDGKVRSSWALPPLDGRQRRLFVTSDRLSAFDRIIARVPWKGQVLNELAAWWFASTTDIVANHVLAVPDPNALVAVAATPLPVEVVVRGHITGVTSTALWTQYAAGERTLYGHRLPDGLRKNDALPSPLVTPTTKAPIIDGVAGHDEPITVADVVSRGLVPARLWGEVVETALLLFARGRQIGAERGLILADTKYEFGVDADGRLLLIDEVHTPDSSRWWVSSTFEERLAAGDEPESIDKEVVRQALAAAGYRGDGPPPHLAPEVWEAASLRYRRAAAAFIPSFTPAEYPVEPRLLDNLTKVGLL